ncbi:MAG: ComEA family DNA-binding protein [candidate division WOR-3 bacterium]
MNKKEIVILAIISVVYLAINIWNYFRYHSLKQSYQLIITEELKQISINTASQHELESIPGIGPALARRIIEYREKNGGFRTVEDLKKVKGIGERLFEKLKPYITL